MEHCPDSRTFFEQLIQCEFFRMILLSQLKWYKNTKIKTKRFQAKQSTFCSLQYSEESSLSVRFTWLPLTMCGHNCRTIPNAPLQKVSALSNDGFKANPHKTVSSKLLQVRLSLRKYARPNPFPIDCISQTQFQTILTSDQESNSHARTSEIHFHRKPGNSVNIRVVRECRGEGYYALQKRYAHTIFTLELELVLYLELSERAGQGRFSFYLIVLEFIDIHNQLHLRCLFGICGKSSQKYKSTVQIFTSTGHTWSILGVIIDNKLSLFEGKSYLIHRIREVFYGIRQQFRGSHNVAFCVLFGVSCLYQVRIHHADTVTVDDSCTNKLSHFRFQ